MKPPPSIEQFARTYAKWGRNGEHVAHFRVRGVVGEYLAPDGSWVADPTVATATMFDTDVEEVPAEWAFEDESKPRPEPR